MRRFALSFSMTLPILCICATCASDEVTAGEAWSDPRYFPSGTPIFASGYCDQPYVTILPGGTWLCVFTTGAGREGAGGQHIVATRSSDEGKTWSRPVKIEPETGPAASWAMPFVTSFGRVYVFYDFNGDRVEHLPGGKKKIRDDMIGWYCFKYSDNGGRTWSERHRLPVRTTACDRGNQWGGEVQVLWGIGKPQPLHNGAVMFAFTKLGKYMLEEGEGWFFRCDNINSEKDAGHLEWRNLPLGEHGVRNPEFGSTQEEHNLVELSDGTLFCVYRTTNGFCAFSTSRDGGESWSLPKRLKYATGAVIPNPRACPRLFKCANGRFLFWFENNHSRSFGHRNPAWISGGVEAGDGTISWSQPEIAVYSDDTSYATGRFSYPDLIEHDEKYWITCTNKVEARIFSIAPHLLRGLWAQVDPAVREQREPPIPDATWDTRALGHGKISLAAWDRSSQLPGLWIDPDRRDQSVSLRFTVRLESLVPGQALFDARTDGGDGVLISTSQDQRVQVSIRTGPNEVVWRTDKDQVGCGRAHSITVILDNGPGIILGLVDGQLCDGDGDEWFGWHRYRDLDAVKNHNIRTNRPPARSLGPVRLNASSTAIANGGHLRSFSIYNRALTISEVVNALAK